MKRNRPPVSAAASGRPRIRLGLAVVALMLAASPLQAIRPERFVHTTEADFEPGETEDVVVTNLGDIKLAAQFAELAELPEPSTVVHDIQALPGGEVYVAAGPEARLLTWDGQALTEVVSLDGEQVFALHVWEGQLLVAISGESSRLAVLADGQLRDVAALEGVRYVWDLMVVGGKVVAATGTEGRLLAIAPVQAGAEPADAEVVTILDSAQPNMLCLASADGEVLYAGTDGEGLVYRIAEPLAAVPEVYVVYDAAEPEIGALLVTAEGVVYAGTADAEQAKPGRIDKPQEAEQGRPAEPASEEGPQDPGDLPDVPPQPAPIENGAAANTPDAVEPAGPVADDAPADDAAGTAAIEAPPEPTAAQRDRLREVIRQRLINARRTGEMQVAVAGGGARRPAGGGSRAARPTGGGAKKQGNAVYRIDRQGFVREVFRESVMILRLLADGERLIVATGNEGQLYRVDPVAEETTILADLEAKQVPVLYATDDDEGHIIVGTANPAALMRLAPGFARKGTYTSAALDASQISLWGMLHLTARLPEAGRLSVQTRSGNVGDPQQGGWSSWSDPTVFNGGDGAGGPLAPKSLKVQSPPARFLQYRLGLEGIGDTTPAIDRVELAYVTPNMRPQVVSLTASYENGGGKDAEPTPQTKLKVEWKTEDPNGDGLVFDIEYRWAETNQWIPVEEDLAQNSYEWDTRAMPDGRYLLRVTASDGPDNPADMRLTHTRVSDPLLIDNTPPTIEAGEPEQREGRVRVTLEVSDGLAGVQRVQYAVNSSEDWQPALPEDLIYDSTSEKVVITIADLSPGSHVLSLRAYDQQNNVRYLAVPMRVE